MTTIYIKDANGQKIAVTVTNEVAAADANTRRAAWRNETKERYYRGRTLDTMTDDAIEYRQEKPESNLMTASPEDEYIAAEEQSEQRAKMLAVLKLLTPMQLEFVKLKKKGMTVSEIARLWGKNQKTVYECYEAVQKKFKDFLR